MITIRLRDEPPRDAEGGSPRRAGFVARSAATIRYLFNIETHVYAFAIAAAVLLSFFPFIVLILSIAKNLLHWQLAVEVTLAGIQEYLPRDPGLVLFVTRNLEIAVESRGKVEALSLLLLLLASNGVFVPLEVALNRLWCFEKDRPYWLNQLMSLGLAFVCGGLVLSATLIATSFASAVRQVALQSATLATVVGFAAPKIAALPCSMLILVLVYRVLPNGHVPLRRVVPAAFWTAIALDLAKDAYRLAWPLLDFRRAYGPFFISVTLLLWGYLAAMIVLAGAQILARPRREESRQAQGQEQPTQETVDAEPPPTVS